MEVFPAEARFGVPSGHLVRELISGFFCENNFLFPSDIADVIPPEVAVFEHSHGEKIIDISKRIHSSQQELLSSLPRCKAIAKCDFFSKQMSDHIEAAIGRIGGMQPASIRLEIPAGVFRSVMDNCLFLVFVVSREGTAELRAHRGVKAVAVRCTRPIFPFFIEGDDIGAKGCLFPHFRWKVSLCNAKGEYASVLEVF